VKLPPRCVDLNEDHIDEALVSVEAMRRLLEHMARIAKPKEGGAKILVAISRIATTACEWLEGALHVEVDELIGATEIAVMSDLGGGVRELIFPRLLLAVEHDELVRAVKLAPRLITPLNFRVRGERMILKRNADGTVAPPAFEIAEDSLRRSLPPALRRSLPPIKPSLAPSSDRSRAAGQSVEGAILARLLPKAAPALVFDELAALDVGWDAGAYSSTVFARETKPPPPPKTPSKLPTQPPPPSQTGKPSKLPPKPSKAPPKPSKAPARPSKAPPRPSKAPPKPSKLPSKPAKPRTRPAIRKVGDAAKPKPKPRSGS